MNDSDRNFDENLANLLRASLGPDAQPRAAVRERLRRELGAGVRAAAQPHEFPTLVLGALTCLVLMWAGWCAVKWAGSVSGGGVAAVAWTLVALNLACLPASGAVIYLRRKHA